MANKLILIFVFTAISPCIFAQGIPPGAPCWPPPCVPIDGGLSIFIVLAAFFGYKLSFKPKN